MTDTPIQTMFKKFAAQKDIELIYGEPIKHGAHCVIPVAKMRYAFGAGSGKGASDAAKNMLAGDASGDGGGAVITVDPVGVYTIDAKKVAFKPARGRSRIVTGLTVLGAAVALIAIGRKQK